MKASVTLRVFGTHSRGTALRFPFSLRALTASSRLPAQSTPDTCMFISGPRNGNYFIFKCHQALFFGITPRVLTAFFLCCKIAIVSYLRSSEQKCDFRTLHQKHTTTKKKGQARHHRPRPDTPTAKEQPHTRNPPQKKTAK